MDIMFCEHMPIPRFRMHQFIKQLMNFDKVILISLLFLFIFDTFNALHIAIAIADGIQIFAHCFFCTKNNENRTNGTIDCKYTHATVHTDHINEQWKIFYDKK